MESTATIEPGRFVGFALDVETGTFTTKDHTIRHLGGDRYRVECGADAETVFVGTLFECVFAVAEVESDAAYDASGERVGG